MKTSLLLNSSSIFEDASTIDCIRQTCIDLKKSPKNEDVKNFLKESIKYLKEDMPFNIFNELLSAIISCFSTNPTGLSKYFNHFLKRAKQNSNYLIVTASILSYLIHIQPPLTLPDYQPFIDDCISEIVPQIQKKNENLNLEVFGHKISPLYETNFIVDILLSINLTEEFFLTFFPYLFSHKLLSDNPKFNFLLENVSKSGVIHILKQNSKSQDDIYQFISNNGYQSLLNLSDECNSLIESVLIYIKCQDKKKMKGIKKETILQFLSVLIIIIKNYKIQEKVSFSSKALLELMIEGVKFLPSFQSRVFNESIDLIVKNYFYINATLSIPSDTLINIFEIILQQIASDVYPANKLIFFYTLFDLFDKIKYYNFRNEIQNFIKTNSDLIVQSILKNLNEINLDYQLKMKKFDFKYFDPNLFIYKLPNIQYFSQLIYFLDNSCANLTIDHLKNTAARLSLNINIKVKEQKWDELMKISIFF